MESHLLYEKLGKALRSLLEILDGKGPLKKVRSEGEKILALATKIGHPLQADAEQLKKELGNFFEHPEDPHILHRLMKQTLRLEQETREI